MKTRQIGSALISALTIILIISSLCTIWISQAHHHIKILQIEIENDKAFQLKEAANVWTVNILKNKRFRQTSPIIAATQGQNFYLPPGWKIEAQISDAQSLFNINSIGESSLRLTFFLLLKDLLSTIQSAPKELIYFSTLTWIDSNISVQRSQEIERIYQNAKPGYQSSQQLFQSIDEWKNVAGMKPTIFNVLKNYFTTLPESTPININTCDGKLIKNLRPGLKDSDVEKILFGRGKHGFKSQDELFAVLQTFKIPVQNTTIFSQYFWLTLSIKTPSNRIIQSKSLFYRPLRSKKDKLVVFKLQDFNEF